MRLIYFGHYWRSYRGMDLDIRTLLKHLSAQGIECLAITYPLIEQEKQLSINVPGVKVLNIEKEPYKDICDSALSVLDKAEGDILLTSFPPEVGAWEIARKKNIKIIQKYSLVYDIPPPDISNLMVDYNVFNSEACKNAWLDRGIEGPNAVIYPEIEVDLKTIPEPGNAIGMINPVSHKGSRIFDNLANTSDEIFLSGGGWATHPGMNLQKHPNRVHIPHMQEISDFYKRLKLLLVPTQDTHFETYGRVIVEAMMHGVPVMASNKDGIPEAANGAAMLIDEYESLEPWVQGLQDMLQKLPKYRELAIERAERYNLEAIINKWAREIKNIIT